MLDRTVHGTKRTSVKRRMCKSCGKTYSTNIGFERLSHAPEVVVDVFNMYGVVNFPNGILTALYERGITISHQAILNRLTRLGPKAYEHTSMPAVTV